MGPVLITGCSSGIGHATALRLARSGHLVCATARRPEALADLAARGCRTLALDLADEASMTAAVGSIEAEYGPVATLVNNAGYAEIAPAELLSPLRVRQQFQANVFGPLFLSQLVLPSMRAAGTGRIINIGSIGDRCVFPLWGGYAATKHALTAFTDALRMETAGTGVDVILIELGVFATNFAAAIKGNIAANQMTESSGGVQYAAQVDGFRALIEGVLASASDPGSPEGLRARLFARLSRNPDLAARTIVTAIRAPRPRTRYRVPAHARLAFATRRLLPDRTWDAAVTRVFLGKRLPR